MLDLEEYSADDISTLRTIVCDCLYDNQIRNELNGFDLSDKYELKTCKLHLTGIINGMNNVQFLRLLEAHIGKK